MSDFTGALVTILVAVIGVATLAVVVSRNSNTSGVITSGGNAFANILRAATAPVAGNSVYSQPLL